MALSKPNPKSAELTRMRIVMAGRGLSNIALSHLPAMKGFCSRRISNLLCGQDKTWPIRAAANRALEQQIFQPPNNTIPRNHKTK